MVDRLTTPICPECGAGPEKQCDLRFLAANCPRRKSIESEIAPPDLMAALRAYEQADHDGVFVTVSREALDKAIELLASPSSAEQFKKPFSPDGAAVVECAVCNGYGKVRLGK